MSLEIILTLSIAGILLVVAEIFIPGGVAGVLGGLLLLVAIIAGFVHSLSLGMILLVSSAGFGLLSFWLWIKFFPRLPIGKRMILATDAKTWHSFADDRAQLVGKTGQTHTVLRPGGIAIIDGQRLDVVTRGELVEANCAIRVIEVEGSRIVVTAQESA